MLQIDSGVQDCYSKCSEKASYHQRATLGITASSCQCHGMYSDGTRPSSRVQTKSKETAKMYTIHSRAHCGQRCACIQKYMSWNAEWYHVLFIDKLKPDLPFNLIFDMDTYGGDLEHKCNHTMCSPSTLTSNCLFWSGQECVLMTTLLCIFVQEKAMSECIKMRLLHPLWHCFMLQLNLHSIFSMAVQPITDSGDWKIMGLNCYSCCCSLQTLIPLITFGMLYSNVWMTMCYIH